MQPHSSSVLEDRHAEPALTNESQDALSRARMRRLRAMFPGEFNKPLTLATSFSSIKRILASSNLSQEEKNYLNKYLIVRERNDSHGTNADVTRFPYDTETTLARLFADENRPVADMLAYLGPRIIHERYGEGVLFWAWQNLTVGVVNEHVRYAFTRYLSQFSDIVGTSERFEYLMKARYTLWRTHGTSNLADTLALFDLFVRLPDFVERTNQNGLGGEFSALSLDTVASIRDLERGRVRGWDWVDVSHDGRSLSQEVSMINNGCFRLEPEERAYAKTVDWSGKTYKLYLDSPVGVVLMKEGLPIAMTGFSLRDAETLFVNQFQQSAFEAFDRHGRMVGNRVDDMAKKLPWQEFFHDMLLDIAKEFGYSKSVLQS